jgi:hypothetical protein
VPVTPSPENGSAIEERSRTGAARAVRVAAPSILFWSLPALLFSALTAADRPETAGRPPIGFAQAFLAYGLPWYFWAAITPVVLRLTRRYPLDSKRRARAIALHVTAGMTAGIAMGTISLTTHVLFGTGQSSPRGAVADILFWTPFGVLFYGALASVGFALDSHRRLRERELFASRMEAQLVEAQLGALRMQLQPHFLFNAMNTVAMLIRQGDAQTAVRVLARLSDLLRQILDDARGQEVPIEEELDLLARYLEIEQLRFGDRLDVRISLADAARGALVPSFLLQPLVENAIRHGIARRASAGRIELDGRREDGVLVLRLRNDGPPLPDDWKPYGAGIGLRNTRARLDRLYGDAASLAVTDAPEGGVAVRIALPWHTRPASPEATRA